MKRTSCSACGCQDLEQFLDLGSSPIADAYTATPDEVSVRYPLQVAACAKCRLVQLLDVVDQDVLFGSNYSFYSSGSPQIHGYHLDQVRYLRGNYPQQVARGVIEIGSNDGDLLQHFPGSLGIDPSTGPAAVAAERGCDVVTEPFGLATAELVRNTRSAAGVVIANHVLAHVGDVADVLAGIKTLLAADGIAMVEVQYLPDLLVNNAFDLVYHEHRNFFSLSSLEQAAGRWDLHVVDARLTDRQGGSLRVTLARRPAPNPTVDRIRASEAWLDNFGAYEGMQGRAERIRTRLLDLIADQNGTVAVYGAPAKATTLLNFCGLTAADLAWCSDLTPAKRGRHIPGTGIPIVEPRNPKTYVLAVWNYAGSVIRANPSPRWIIPFPAPVIL